MTEDICLKLARKVKENGGRAFYVGGYVRDVFLNKISKDIDIEVHGISEEELVEIKTDGGKG